MKLTFENKLELEKLKIRLAERIAAGKLSVEKVENCLRKKGSK